MYQPKCPYTRKKELVNWLIDYYAKYNKKGMTKSKANKLTKKNLYWFYYNLPGLLNDKSH